MTSVNTTSKRITISRREKISVPIIDIIKKPRSKTIFNSKINLI